MNSQGMRVRGKGGAGEIDTFLSGRSLIFTLLGSIL